MKRSLVLVSLLAAALSVSLYAQSQRHAFDGDWKLNTEKSTYSPGPAPKSATVKIDGAKTKYHSEDPDSDWSVLIPNEGAPAAIDGIPNSTVIGKWIGETEMEHHWDFNGDKSVGKGKLTADRKSFTYTMVGKTADGTPIHDVQVWEKQ